MTATNYVVVLKLGNGLFKVCNNPDDPRGFAPQEVWVFGLPRTPKQLETAASAEVGWKCLAEKKIHHL